VRGERRRVRPATSITQSEALGAARRLLTSAVTEGAPISVCEIGEQAGQPAAAGIACATSDASGLRHANTYTLTSMRCVTGRLLAAGRLSAFPAKYFVCLGLLGPEPRANDKADANEPMESALAHRRRPRPVVRLAAAAVVAWPRAGRDFQEWVGDAHLNQSESKFPNAWPSKRMANEVQEKSLPAFDSFK
jgi:hypothetical protein